MSEIFKGVFDSGISTMDIKDFIISMESIYTGDSL